MARDRLTATACVLPLCMLLLLQSSVHAQDILNTLKLNKGSAACKIVLQGELARCRARTDFAICTMDLTCVGEQVLVDVHQALNPFVKDLQGIKARVVNNATELLKFTAPSNITFIESAINNVRLTRDGMVIMSFNDSTDVTIMGTGFFNNTGRYNAPLRLQGGSSRIQNSTFVLNRAVRAGAVIVRNAKLQVNSSSFANNGINTVAPEVGVLSLENSTVSIINSSMTQNWGQMVGAVWIDRGSVVDLKYTDMVNNTIARNVTPPADWRTRYNMPLSSGMGIVRSSQLSMTNIPIKANTGPDGSGLLVLNGSTVMMETSDVHSNDNDSGLSAIALLPANETLTQPAVAATSAGAPSASAGPPATFGQMAPSSLDVVNSTFWNNTWGDISCGVPESVTVLRLELVDGGAWRAPGKSERQSGEVSC